MNWWGKQGMNYGPHSTDEALSLPMTLAQGHMANKWQARPSDPLSIIFSLHSSTYHTPTQNPYDWQIEATELAGSWLGLQLAPWLLNLLMSHFNGAVAG